MTAAGPGRTPLSGRHVGVIGAGNLGQALVRGLLAAGHPRTDVHLSTRRTESGRVAARDLGVTGHPRNRAVVEAADIVLITVKPSHVLAVLDEIRPALGARPLITCAAGVATATCRAALHDDARVGRAMPNVAAAVRSGAAALWLPPTLAPAEAADCRAVFEASCAVVDLPDEGLFAVATALVGSGPAFTCVFAEALADGAVDAGLPRDLAHRLAAATVRGAGALLVDTGEHPAVWKDRVTSPGGTTAAGLAALERGGLRAAAWAAISAATGRAEELGDRVRCQAERPDRQGQ